MPGLLRAVGLAVGASYPVCANNHRIVGLMRAAIVHGLKVYPSGAGWAVWLTPSGHGVGLVSQVDDITHQNGLVGVVVD